MVLEVLRSGRDGAGRLIDALTAWAPRHAPVLGLHAGDVGWHLRHDDDVLDGSLLVIRDGATPVAVALVEMSGAVIRPAIDPEQWDDLEVAEVLANLTDALPGSADAYSDAPSHGAYRSVLSARGWEIDPDPWAVLFRPVSSADGGHHDPLTTTLETGDDVADRVAVQFAAFEHSTLTVPRWHQMAGGPGYDRRFDLLRRDESGVPVAGGTGWLPQTGRVGILEPVGTHRDHVGQGHGRAVSLAVIAALARAGASGVAVQTPLSNVAALATYQACGMRVVERLHAMVRRSSDTSAD
jgi:GNAT superfamily N-acetyltransferase